MNADRRDLVFHELTNRPLAIVPGGLDVICNAGPIDAVARDTAPRGPFSRRQGAVAVIPIFGPVTPRGSLLGGTSALAIQGAIRQAIADSSVSAVVLQFDSGGGDVSGIPELASEIYAARARKPIVAVSDCSALSAAYWLAASAGEVVCTPSGDVGSIGVVAVHVSERGRLEKAGIAVSLIHAGQFKTEGNPWEELSDEARAALQTRVDAAYQAFVSDVARGRGVSVSRVRDGFGQGRIVTARQALALGMIDQVDTLDNTVARLLSGSARTPATQATATARLRLADAERRRLVLLGLGV